MASLGLNIIVFFSLLIDGEFHTARFRHGPHPCFMWRFRLPKNSMLPPRASRAFPSKISHLSLPEGVIYFFWKYSLQKLELKEHDCTSKLKQKKIPC